jgi:hypothetical protein
MGYIYKMVFPNISDYWVAWSHLLRLLEILAQQLIRQGGNMSGYD